MHFSKSDGIFVGLAKKLGREPYFKGGQFSPIACYELPKTTVGALAQHIEDVPVQFVQSGNQYVWLKNEKRQ